MLKNRIDILIADDHRIVRNGLKSMLLGKPGFFVAAEAEDGKACLALAQKVKPDVVLLDIDMPGMSGIEVARQLVGIQAGVKILMLTALDSKEQIMASVRAGASGFLSKNCDSRELITAIEKVASGEHYFSKAITGDVFTAFVDTVQHKGPADGNRLSDRETEVLRLLADGKRTKEIAATLGISSRTVEGHKTALIEKFGVDSLIEVVRYAIRHKIIDP